ncbi:MAG: hypothetical protein H6733_06415 [Alphaproteobacteria bacterium]|nr:hypothetical protein [Alphaproteobacteria bacterium]
MRVPRPKDAILYFDGLPSRLRPVERPTVVQLQDGAGTMLRTAYLRPGEPMIAYQTAPRTRTALAITAGVSAAIFGALFGSSFGVRSAYFRTDSSDGATLDRLRTTTNALAATGIAFGAVALGTGVGAAAVGPR